MKLIFVLLVGIGISAVGLYSFWQYSEERPNIQSANTPESVVQRFCDLSREGEFEQLGRYITDYPEAYFRSKEEEVVLYKKKMGMVSEMPNDETVENTDKVKIVGFGKPDLRGVTLIAHHVSRRFHRDSLYIKEVKNIWIDKDQARVRVELGSQSIPSYLAEADFLLHDEGEWKVFLVDTPSVFNAYGVPRSDRESAQGN